MGKEEEYPAAAAGRKAAGGRPSRCAIWHKFRDNYLIDFLAGIQDTTPVCRVDFPGMHHRSRRSAAGAWRLKMFVEQFDAALRGLLWEARRTAP
jgi:hypothetical protein